MRFGSSNSWRAYGNGRQRLELIGGFYTLSQVLFTFLDFLSLSFSEIGWYLGKLSFVWTLIMLAVKMKKRE